MAPATSPAVASNGPRRLRVALLLAMLLSLPAAPAARRRCTSGATERRVRFSAGADRGAPRRLVAAGFSPPPQRAAAERSIGAPR